MILTRSYRLKHLCAFSNSAVKWKWRVILPLSLITSLFVLVTMFSLSALFTVTPHRPKAKIIVMNEGLCIPPRPYASPHRTLIIVIPSARKHFNRRNIVRQTYGSVKYENNVEILGVLFILAYRSGGQEEEDVDDNRRLLAEADRLNDMIIGDFVDSYRNLTLKTIMAYDWLATYCRNAQFVVKTDDDTVVNIYELTEFLSSLPPAEVKSSKIWGRVHRHEDTVKDPNSVFYAAPTDFPTGFFPDHCSGNGYVTTFEVIDQLVEDISKSFLGRVSTHEDVFMTAIVPNHINSNPKYLWRETEPITLVQGMNSINLIFHNGTGDHDHFLRDFHRDTTMDLDSKNCVTFKERYPRNFFFLIGHTDELEQVHLRLWDIIKKCYTT